MPESPAPPADGAPVASAPEAALPAPGLLAGYRLPLIIVGAHVLLFLLARIVLFVLHHEDFRTLTAGETIGAFLRGFRFDASVIFTLLFLPVTALLAPNAWSRASWWWKPWAWVSWAVFVVFLLTLSVDVVYFGFVHRHLGPEVTFLGSAFEELSSDAFLAYTAPIVGFILLVAFLFWGWKRTIAKMPVRPAGRTRLEAGVFLVVVLAMYVMARGAIGGKRLKVINAFSGGPVASAYLALNGPFAALNSVEELSGLKLSYVPGEEAIRGVQADLTSPAETAVGGERDPLFRHRGGREGRKPNVVLVMLESQDGMYTDAIRREHGLPPLGLTPNLDALAREGLLFTRFYACGQRSINGMCALLSGFPCLPHTPYLGHGLEQSRLSYLGAIAKAEDYDTFFIQGSVHTSFRCDLIAPLAGFNHYQGGEDIPTSPPATARVGAAAWDHEMFTEANRQLAASKKPFLAFLYTTSMHFPFVVPEKRWEVLEHKESENRFRNTMKYADDAIGNYIAGAKAAGYYDNTIFIFTADHIRQGGKQENPSTMHHIPCIIVAPGLKPGIDKRIGGQLDVIPTIADLAGWKTPYASLGRSLLDPDASKGSAFCVQGDLVLRVEDGGSILHNLRSRVIGRDGDAATLDAIEKRLLYFIEAASLLHRENRIVPDSAAR